MSTFNIHSANRLPPGPSGLGAKVIQGHLSLCPAKEAVHPYDVKLNTINALVVVSPSIGSSAFVTVFAAGSFDSNYASIKLYDMSGSEAPAIYTTGSLEAKFVAFGE